MIPLIYEKICRISAVLILLVFPPGIFAENIDPFEDGSQYAYGENVGWLNAEPLGNQGPGVEVGEFELSGFIWAENIGWISLSCRNTTSCPEVTYGVVNDGAGFLSGFAWGENVGWIDFDPPYGGVGIDADGDLYGWAWGENIGWIRFQDPLVPYKVQTSWTPQPADQDGDGIADTVDTEPLVYSNDFSDGTTTGSIADRGQQLLTVTDVEGPVGVLIQADIGGGLESATIYTCSGTAQYTVTAGDEFEVTCGSVAVNVISGMVKMLLFALDGTVATVSLNEGNALEFEPAASLFTVPETNTESVLILIDGKTISLDPGEHKRIVHLDIKPGSCPNPLNVKSKGVLPAAVLGSEHFDVKTIDVETIRLSRQGAGYGSAVPIRWNYEDIAASYASTECESQELDSEGYLDLNLKFHTQALVEVIGDVDDDEEIVLTIRGELSDGTPFEGADGVMIIDKRK